MEFSRAAGFACSILLFSFLNNISLAEVTLPSLLADHMVVQRGMPVHVWGMEIPQESVSVTFRRESKFTTADALGQWSLYLSPGEAAARFT